MKEFENSLNKTERTKAQSIFIGPTVHFADCNEKDSLSLTFRLAIDNIRIK